MRSDLAIHLERLITVDRRLKRVNRESFFDSIAAEALGVITNALIAVIQESTQARPDRL